MNPKLRIVWHVLFWVFIYSDEFLSLVGITPPLEETHMFVINLITNASIVYFNIYVLLPYLLNKGQTFLFIVASILCVCSIIYLDYKMFPCEDCEFSLSEFLSNFVFNSFLIAIPVSIKLIKKAFMSQLQKEKSDSEKLNLELAYLKNQVNPHFLFNTLNSLYIQSKKKDNSVSESILSLSDILRYQLYDCQKETVSISKEVEYLNNYLELEKQRRDQLEVNFSVDLHNNNFPIEPLLFLPLIENAVKYSQTDNKHRAYIDINLTSSEDKIGLVVRNNKGYKTNENSPQSGIGLSNLRRRLELYYPNKHALNIFDNAESFEAELMIQARK